MRLQQKYQLFVIVLFMVVVSSCGKDSACFKGTGDIVKEQRNITTEVTSIITEDNINIVIAQSNDAGLVVEGGENLLAYVNTEISGSVLSLNSDNRCGMFRDNTIPITVYLSIPNLTKIEYTGQGNISSANILNFPSFEFDSFGGTGSVNLNLNVGDLKLRQHSGPADFTIAGNVNKLYVYTLGQGWFYLDQLVANSAHVNHSGIGDVFVNVKNELSVELRSRGSVYYVGVPAVSVSPNIGEGVVEAK
jgi:hypothetical protein